MMRVRTAFKISLKILLPFLFIFIIFTGCSGVSENTKGAGNEGSSGEDANNGDDGDGSTDCIDANGEAADNKGTNIGGVGSESFIIEGNVEVWLTTSNQKNLLAPQESIVPATSAADTASTILSERTISVDPGLSYQKMDGFGASFTDTSAWLVSKALDKESRADLMSKLFSYENGIGISFLRQPMGSSDFALKLYTYDDVPEGSEDLNLNQFSIGHDRKYILPMVRDALQLNPELKIMATPWSPPAWMKTNGNLIGGTLRGDCYDALSRYFVAFIQAYKAEGVPIYAVSVQNEPLYSPAEYPGMKMQPYEQARFIGSFLGPAFEKNEITTKILSYDHNWDNPRYPEIVLEEAGKYVAGTAWHSYGGTHSAMTRVYQKFPDKGVWFTEASGGQWVPPFYDAFADQMMHIIRGTRNYAKTVVWWNIALDSNNGPSVLSNSTCRGLVGIDTDTGKITYNVDYYTIGHISKFVRSGAFRIESDNYDNDVETAAFKNPDGSIVLIVSSRTSNDRNLTVKYRNSSFNYKLLGRSAVTFYWK